jgi:hypothetical protein
VSPRAENIGFYKAALYLFFQLSHKEAYENLSGLKFQVSNFTLCLLGLLVAI